MVAQIAEYHFYLHTSRGWKKNIQLLEESFLLGKTLGSIKMAYIMNKCWTPGNSLKVHSKILKSKKIKNEIKN